MARVSQAGAAVLLVSHSGDGFVVDRVDAALRRRGARPARLEVDRFPAHLTLTTELGRGGARRALRVGEVTLEGAEVGAVWLRRLWAPNLGEGIAEAYREACVRESLDALRGFVHGLPARAWINDPVLSTRAEDKQRQLEVAVTVGLEVPETVVTNDPEVVRAFFARMGGRVVAKMLTPFSMSMDGGSAFVYTNAISDADLEALDGLRQSPMVFQERVPKARELRVAYVGGRCFAGALDASRYESLVTDWRDPRALETGLRWEPGALPDDVAERVDALMRALGLVYGGVDIILTPDGRHVFLEVNPSGEWGMLEHDLGLPISDAIATALLERMEAP